MTHGPLRAVAMVAALSATLRTPAEECGSAANHVNPRGSLAICQRDASFKFKYVAECRLLCKDGSCVECCKVGVVLATDRFIAEVLAKVELRAEAERRSGTVVNGSIHVNVEQID